jgi:hypothetical protein
MVNADFRAETDIRNLMAKKKVRISPPAPRSPLETARLLDGCRRESDVAAREVFDRYLVRLTALARTRISAPRRAIRRRRRCHVGLPKLLRRVT